MGLAGGAAAHVPVDGYGASGLRRAGEALLAVIILATFTGVGAFSPGYDDEFYNIMAISGADGLVGLVRRINLGDVHPPLSYVANALTHRLLGSWGAVRALNGFGVAVCLLLFLRAAVGARRDLLLPCLLVAGLHPTLVMWTASLRWTSYFTAFLLLALTLILRNPRRAAPFWGGLAVLLVAMFHTNYEALLLAPGLVALALHARWQRLRGEWPVALAALGLGALLCVPQVVAGLSWQLGRRSGQTGTLLAGLSGAAQGYLINSGLFALSPAGLLNAASVGGLAVLAAVRHGQHLLRMPLVLFWLGATILMVLTGIAVKPRNFTPLIPVLFVLLTILALTSNRPRLALVLLGGVVAAQMLGLLQVIAHRDTGKGSWNLPVAAVMEAVRTRAASCPGATSVAVYDVVLANLLAQERGLHVISLYTRATTRSDVVPAGDCLLVVETYRGSLSPALLDRLRAALPHLPADRIPLAPDPHAAMKQRFDADIPDAYVTLRDYGPLTQAVDLGVWRGGAALRQPPLSPETKP